jgi:uncharacterized membrane protein YccF (DUF307 family)
MTNSIHSTTKNNPGCLIQLLWFALVGWWACQLWIAAAWFFMVIIITIPLGVKMINLLPKIVALREPFQQMTYKGDGTLTIGDLPQYNILVRALYFVLIGWWFSALWMELAYVFCCTIIGMPLGFWMFDKTPGLLTLRRQ